MSDEIAVLSLVHVRWPDGRDVVVSLSNYLLYSASELAGSRAEWVGRRGAIAAKARRRARSS